MRFSLPCLPAEFEIPDEWWHEAGMDGFLPTGSDFLSSADAQLVALRDIEPPTREHPLDWRGFRRDRFISILGGIAAGNVIPAVRLKELPHNPSAVPPDPFRYRVGCGVHRFYASVAAGFTCLPVAIFP